MSKERFEKWLEENTSLSERSKKAYIGAIDQLSAWYSTELGIIENLYDLEDTVRSNLIEELESSKAFQDKNQSGNRMWSSALKYFKYYIQKVDYENPIIKKIKQHYEKLLSQNKLWSIDHIDAGYDLFAQKFNPDILKNLDGEMLLNTIFHFGNKDSLCYWLEFKNDEEFKSSLYGSIAGGSAFKFVMFKRNVDGSWVTGNPQNPTMLTIDEAIKIGREIRDNLITGADLIKKLSDNANIEEYLTLQEKLQQELSKYNLHSLGWVHKYYHMLYPNKIDSYHSAKWQNHLLIKSNIKPIADNETYILSGQLMQIVKQTNIPTLHLMQVMHDLFASPLKYYRIGTSDGEKSYWDEMKDNAYVAIGWAELGNLDEYVQNNGIDNIKDYMKEELVKTCAYDNKTASRKAGEILRFYKDIQIDDIVVAVMGEKVLGIGKVNGNYEFITNRAYPHSRSVEWIKIFNEDVKLPKASAGKLTTCFPYNDLENIIEIERLMNDDELEDLKVIDRKPIPPTTPVTLAALTGVMAEIESVLFRKKQVILYGPPGTGKTYYAEKTCCELASRQMFRKSFTSLTHDEQEKILGNDKEAGLVRTCCFHPSYGYEDFIEGVKPRLIDKQTVFELKDGIFKNICEDACNNPDKKYFLIIDEINRGDISRIFGELIMLIEKAKRGKKIFLPYSNDIFYVPENLYLVGTMNTADRSIALLDVALRRRFGFIELMPEYNLFNDIAIMDLPLAIWLKALNERICEHLGKEARNLQIGHSYFLENEKAILETEKFKRIIREDIIPLIEEYCYGDYDLIAKVLGEGLVDVQNQLIRYELFNSSNTDNLITALLSSSPVIFQNSNIRYDEKKDEGVDPDIEDETEIENEDYENDKSTVMNND